jgi:hypothetical protein
MKLLPFPISISRPTEARAVFGWFQARVPQGAERNLCDCGAEPPHVVVQSPALIADIVTAGPNFLLLLNDGNIYRLNVIDAELVRQVTRGRDITRIAVAQSSRMIAALGGDGRVYLVDPNGSLAPVSGLVDIKDIQGGEGCVYALTGGGVVQAVWTRGKVDNRPRVQMLPFLGAGAEAVVEIACGVQHVIARDSDGVVWGWGRNSYAPLGEIERTGDPFGCAIRLDFLDSPAIALSADGFYSLIRCADGSVFLNGMRVSDAFPELRRAWKIVDIAWGKCLLLTEEGGLVFVDDIGIGTPNDRRLRQLRVRPVYGLRGAAGAASAQQGRVLAALLESESCLSRCWHAPRQS